MLLDYNWAGNGREENEGESMEKMEKCSDLLREEDREWVETKAPFTLKLLAWVKLSQGSTWVQPTFVYTALKTT